MNINIMIDDIVIRRNCWYAGFWEAEGSCTGNSASLAQNDPFPIVLVQHFWGGRFEKRVRKSPASDKICTGHVVYLRTKETKAFINDITPYLRVPRKIKRLEDHSSALDKSLIKDKLDKDELCVYMAGFWEGDGYVSTDISANNSLLVGMDQQTVEPLNLALEQWGGDIRRRVRKSPASDKICTTYTWVAKRKAAEKFLEDIEPYLMIPLKIAQIEEALSKVGDKPDKRYSCKYCDKTFSNPPNRKRHEREYHERTEKFKCDQCSAEYRNAESLNYHIESKHRSQISKPWCHICEKTYSSTIVLRRHNKKFHSKPSKSNTRASK